MTTTTVRLDEDDERLLDKLAPAYGGRSNAIRHALRQLSSEDDRQEALREFLAEWEGSSGPADEAAIEDMAERYGL
jgi:predicted transcriptional regulator